MKICVLIDAWEPIWGGGQTHVWEISKRIIQRTNWKIDIFTRALIDENGKRYVNNKTYLKSRLCIFRIGPITSFFNVFGRVFWIAAVIIAILVNHFKEPYQLIHAHAYVGGIPGKIVSLLLGIPVVFTVHGSNNLDLGKNKIAAFLESIILTKISYTKEISVSKHFLQYKNVNKNIVVIPNGVDVSLFDNIRKTNKGEFFNILWVGRFDKVKGVDVLIKSFAKFIIKNKKCILNLVGYGYEEKSLKKLSKKLNLDKYIKFLGKKKHNDLIRIYKSCDLFILPSLSEGQSITILEAWAAKLPVIATNVGDNAKIIDEGKNGFLISPNNIKVIYKALSNAVVIKTLSNVGRNGYQKVKKHYTWDYSADALKKIYDKYSC